MQYATFIALSENIVKLIFSVLIDFYKYTVIASGIENIGIFIVLNSHGTGMVYNGNTFSILFSFCNRIVCTHPP